MTKAVIAFFIGVAVYLTGLGIFCIVKAVRNRRKYKKELAQDEEENKSETSDN